MTPNSRHLREELQDLLDGRLNAAERAEVQAHVDECLECRDVLRRLEWTRQTTARARMPIEPPPSLRSDILRALDFEDAPIAPRRSRAWIVWPAALAAGAVLLASIAIVWFVRGRADVPAAVAADCRGYRSGAISLDRTTAVPSELEAFVATGLRFHTRVFDLGMMSYRLAGGRIETLAGRPAAAYTYRGIAGQTLLCEMYEGRLADLTGDAIVRDHEGIRFRVYRIGAITLAFWQEKDIICVLASVIDPDALVQLAFAKASKL